MTAVSGLIESDGKLCSRCERTLPPTEFHRNRRRPDGPAFHRTVRARERPQASRRERGVQPRKRAAATVTDGLKWCPDCDRIKPLSACPANKRQAGGHHGYRGPCHNARGRGASQRLHGGSRDYHLRRRYGIGLREFVDLPAAQGGVHAICGAPDPEHPDHDHRTGRVRGILCFNCNGGLGQFRDNRGFVARAITYLKGTTWQRVLIHPGVYQMCSPTQGRPPSRSS
jgi:hypothetical protein